MKTSSVTVSMLRPHLRDLPNYSLSGGYSLHILGHGNEPQLAELLSSAFGEVWDVSQVSDHLTRAPDVKAVYGVFRQHRLVATASSQYRPDRDPEAGFVHWVATHPDNRGQGLATALLAHVLSDFSTRGYSRARLDTQPERPFAIRVYLKFGFVPEYEWAGVDQRELWSDIFPKLLRVTA